MDPSENAEIADMLHGMGREFGATTGRARRCGWFDSVATRHATMVNGIDDLAVTNIDGLDTVETIKVCIGYRDGKKKYDYVPNDIEVLTRCVPVYAEFPGWCTPTHNARSWKDLPPKARSYLKAIAELTEAIKRVALVADRGAQVRMEFSADTLRLSAGSPADPPSPPHPRLAATPKRCRRPRTAIPSPSP